MIVALSAGRTSPPALRARLALDEAGIRNALSAARPGVGEVVVISTCHRTEVYATAEGLEADAVHAVAAILPGVLPTDQHDMRFLQGSDAIEHLFKVACGLDSLVVGEPQVLAQVRRSLVLAENAGATGPVMKNIFGRAIRLGRRTRAETALGRLGNSIGSIAADYLEARLGDMEGRAVTVVGTGEAASDAARALRKAGASIRVCGRRMEAAESLAEAVQGEAVELDSLEASLARSVAAVIAVNGGVLLKGSDIPVGTSDNPYLVLDLSMPPSVEQVDTEGIEVRLLEEIPGPRGPEVTEAVIEAEALVKKEVADLQHWADTRASGGSIKDLRDFAEQIVDQEVRKTMSAMNLSIEDEERIHQLTRRISNKLLHGPTAAMRRSDEITRDAVRKMFGLDR